ncbi:hypothetical protein NLJ89_g6517 [Agrocybe chaxingu]|uniref:Uncharacterized protein n=1 Tax=Agrocybe chaxingu TaxID=84603 RepID=A0A9W8MUJ7_9AGAR|nr:hypothetical protein NLJ89_g6517 [Agrocybe chaxingu]
MRSLLFCLRVPNLENFACIFPIVPNEEPIVSNVLLLHFGSLITHLELQTHSKYFDIRSLWRDAPHVTHLYLKGGPDAPLLSDSWLSHTMFDVSAERRVSIKSKLEVLEFKGPQGFSWTALADMLDPPDEKMEAFSAKTGPYAQLRRKHLKRVDLCLLSRLKPIPTRIKHRLEKAQENGLQLRIRDWMGSHLISPSLE